MTVVHYGVGKYGSGVYGTIGPVPTTYFECLNFINDSELVSTKLRYIALLPTFRIGRNPEYINGLTALAKETNETVRQALLNEVFNFLYPLTDEEKNSFSYFLTDYIANNPGVIDGVFSSYVGSYQDENGNPT